MRSSDALRLGAIGFRCPLKRPGNLCRDSFGNAAASPGLIPRRAISVSVCASRVAMTFAKGVR